jgi:hypothetical protein
VLPTSARPLRAIILVAIAATAGLSSAPDARALDLDVGPPRLQGGYLWVDARLRDVFPARVEETLARGMPARLQLHAELWRKRTAWFDRLSGSFDADLKIRYDVWNRCYRLERRAAATVTTTTLDSIGLLLSRPIALPLAPARGIPPTSSCYVVVSVTLKPLSVEDVEEGEGWLSGEVANRRGGGVGIITAIPRSLFDAVRNFAGLGDQHARAITEPFEVDALPTDQ